MRDPKLEALLHSLETSLLEKPQDFQGRHVADTVFKALRDFPGKARETRSGYLPVLDNLPRALEISKSHSSRTQPLGVALEQVLFRVPWKQSKLHTDSAFNERLANAVIVGDGGLEERLDFTIGISLAAPGAGYPLHNHPPEELYLAMAGGEFRHGDDDWTPVETGETFYNSPGIFHAMRASNEPLLAIWIFGGADQAK
ncbi:dimethylsulfoniopropionate lyase [Mesorhizobium australicum]|uniref:dimethylsulfonioproprionate lyase family protein n=1 Tax=Mesorhizobium australicum TaxID=536018 RepID=UPI003336F4A5